MSTFTANPVGIQWGHGLETACARCGTQTTIADGSESPFLCQKCIDRRDADIAQYDRKIFRAIDDMEPHQLREFIDGIESRGRGGWWDECIKRAAARLDADRRSLNADYHRYVLIEQGYSEFVGTSDEQVREAYTQLGSRQGTDPDDVDEEEEPERWDGM